MFLERARALLLKKRVFIFSIFKEYPGQHLIHNLHLTHFSISIIGRYNPSTEILIDIAFSGQIPTHVPHPVQSWFSEMDAIVSIFLHQKYGSQHTLFTFASLRFFAKSFPFYYKYDAITLWEEQCCLWDKISWMFLVFLPVESEIKATSNIWELI